MMSRMIGMEILPSGRTWIVLDRSTFFQTVISSTSSAPMMYSLLTAFESFSIMCSEASLCLFATSPGFSLEFMGTVDSGFSPDLTADTGPTGLGSHNPRPTEKPIESQTIRKHMMRFITHGPFLCQNKLFTSLCHNDATNKSFVN